jgi:hypothetical protein
VPRARILTWGYDVRIEHVFESVSQASVFQHAEDLLSDLAACRSTPASAQRPLIFVAHSLGGIVVKDALSLSRLERTHLNEILPATAGVLFLGTPHRGSKAASIGKIAFELSKLFFKEPNVQVLRALEMNSEVLTRIGRSFEQILADGNIQIHSFSEEIKTKGLMIVDSFSSTTGHVMETRGTIHANHRNMTKFASEDDIGFKRVSAVLQRWEDGISGRSSSFRDYKKCLESLDMPEARDRIIQVGGTFRDTYSWLFTRVVGFEDWLEGKNPRKMYWIQGKPASGKSTMMKYAMGSSSTRAFLQRCNPSQWIITGFFFHDRGSSIQKSIQGFLCEVLYQVLNQQQHLFSIVASKYRVHSEKETSMVQWNAALIEDFLSSIARNTTSDVNLCLFVDALDEHEGSHRELIALLNRLLPLTENPYFRLRLCLAGRPENVFKDAFYDCPGFAIHHYTEGDIRAYTSGRLKSELGQDLTEQSLVLNELIEEVIEKAQGVFLWVRLVVDELVEGLCEGDHIEELRDLLATMPSELEDLYLRALTRSHKYSTRALTKHQYETYVMFQLAVCSKESQPLSRFLQASLFHTRDVPTISESLQLSEAQMIRRVNNRSSGLLETVFDSANRRVVQFIHQTVKDFVSNGKGLSLFHRNADSRFTENGHTLMFRYLLHLFQHGGDHDAKLFIKNNFLHHAQHLDCLGDISVVRRLKEVFPEEKEQKLTARIFYEILDYKYGRHGSFIERIDRSRFLDFNPQRRILVFCMLGPLPRSFKRRVTFVYSRACRSPGSYVSGLHRIWFRLHSQYGRHSQSTD